MEAFVYCWTDTATSKLYVGWHKGSVADGYICSSKMVLQEYAARPQDFTRQIVAEGSAAEMVKLEHIILNSVGARKNPSFYNRHNGDGKWYNKGNTAATRLKISAGKRGLKRPDVLKRNLENNATKDPLIAKKCGRPMQGSANPMFGRLHSEESKQAMKANRRGKGRQPKSPETRRLMSEARSRYWENKRAQHANQSAL